MSIAYEFSRASGESIVNCHWLGLRFDEEHEFTPSDGESWIGQNTIDGRSYTHMSQRGWMTGLWRTESKVWVSEADGRVYMNPSFAPNTEPWQTFDLEGSITGIWGLSDKLVFAWGVVHPNTPRAYCYNGKSWRQVDTPGFIGAVRGPSKDLIYAVGQQGLIARWDGNAFRAVHSPTESNLSDVFVESEDEIYAASPDGVLLSGTVHGFEELLLFDGMLHCVAKWGGDVWVGAGDAGLFKVVDEELELIKPTVKAEQFDAREALLISTPGAIAETRDGSAFQASFVATFSNLADQHPITWR